MHDEAFIHGVYFSVPQASGIDGVLYYAPVLFTQAGLSSTKASFLASGVSGLLNVACTIITQPFMDKCAHPSSKSLNSLTVPSYIGGRRPTTILGGTLIGSAMLIIGSLYASQANSTEAGRWSIIILIYLFVVAFSMTWAVVNRIYCSEIQPNETRAAATSLGQCMNWVSRSFFLRCPASEPPLRQLNVNLNLILGR